MAALLAKVGMPRKFNSLSLLSALTQCSITRKAPLSKPAKPKSAQPYRAPGGAA